MKKLIILLIAIIIIGLFSGCGTESNEIVSTWKRCGEIKRSGDNLDIYYDINTKVMYADVSGTACSTQHAQRDRWSGEPSSATGRPLHWSNRSS